MKFSCDVKVSVVLEMKTEQCNCSQNARNCILQDLRSAVTSFLSYALAKYGSFGGHFLARQYAKLKSPVKLNVKLPNYYGVYDTEMEGLQSEISIVYFVLAIFSIRDDTLLVTSSAMTCWH